MEEKIQWYEEILSLDPSSTLFFPLARLYLQKSDTEKAVEVLLKGIEKHPEHVEARLLLCDLFEGMGRTEERDGLIGEISSLLSRYPSFWAAWAERLQQQGEGDLAAAASFLGANLGGSKTSWGDVLLAGLASLGSGGQAAVHGAGAGVSPSGPTEGAPAEEGTAEPEEPRKSPGPDKPGGEGREEIIELVDDQDDQGVEYLEAEIDDSEETSEDQVEAPTTYRTKTMADILAGQGDYDGALEIYQELLDETSDSSKRGELEERIQAVRQKRASETEEMGKASGRKEKSAKKDLLQRMEKLAERLEARG